MQTETQRIHSSCFHALERTLVHIYINDFVICLCSSRISFSGLNIYFYMDVCLSRLEAFSREGGGLITRRRREVKASATYTFPTGAKYKTWSSFLGLIQSLGGDVSLFRNTAGSSLVEDILCHLQDRICCYLPASCPGTQPHVGHYSLN